MVKKQLANSYALSLSTFNMYVKKVPGLERTEILKVSIFTPYERQCIINFWGEPAPFVNKKQLAQQYNISRQTLYSWLNVHSIKFTYTMVTPAEQIVLKSILG